MSNVFIFGAGASREYEVPATAISTNDGRSWRFAHKPLGPLPLDRDFLLAMEDVWQEWRHPDLPTRQHQHYDLHAEWDWPRLKAAIEARSGETLMRVGFEHAFGLVADDSELRTQFCRGIELTFFRKLRRFDEGLLSSHVTYMRAVLQPGDTIITFNYDSLVEAALGLLGRPDIGWNPADGYGLSFEGVFRDGDGRHPFPDASATTVRLL